MSTNGKIIERSDLPVVAINLLTKNRTDCAIRTIHGILRNLKYEGELKWFVSDNGSTGQHIGTVEKTIPNSMRLPVFVDSVVGTIASCWNIGLREIFKHTDYYLRLEDDMVLKAPLDITPYIKAMMLYPPFSMVRLGQMVSDLDMETVSVKIPTYIGYEQDVYLVVSNKYQYRFSGHPAIIHKRFHEFYGYFEERYPMTAGELELDMDEKVHRAARPMIVFPWDMGRFGTWGAWDHIGSTKA